MPIVRVPLGLVFCAGAAFLAIPKAILAEVLLASHSPVAIRDAAGRCLPWTLRQVDIDGSPICLDWQPYSSKYVGGYTEIRTPVKSAATSCGGSTAPCGSDGNSSNSSGISSINIAVPEVKGGGPGAPQQLQLRPQYTADAFSKILRQNDLFELPGDYQYVSPLPYLLFGASAVEKHSCCISKNTFMSSEGSPSGSSEITSIKTACSFPYLPGKSSSPVVSANLANRPADLASAYVHVKALQVAGGSAAHEGFCTNEFENNDGSKFQCQRRQIWIGENNQISKIAENTESDTPISSFRPRENTFFVGDIHVFTKGDGAATSTTPKLCLAKSPTYPSKYDIYNEPDDHFVSCKISYELRAAGPAANATFGKPQAFNEVFKMSLRASFRFFEVAAFPNAVLNDQEALNWFKDEICTKRVRLILTEFKGDAAGKSMCLSPVVAPKKIRKKAVARR